MRPSPRSMIRGCDRTPFPYLLPLSAMMNGLFFVTATGVKREADVRNIRQPATPAHRIASAKTRMHGTSPRTLHAQHPLTLFRISLLCIHKPLSHDNPSPANSRKERTPGPTDWPGKPSLRHIDKIFRQSNASVISFRNDFFILRLPHPCGLLPGGIVKRIHSVNLSERFAETLHAPTGARMAAPSSGQFILRNNIAVIDSFYGPLER